MKLMERLPVKNTRYSCAFRNRVGDRAMGFLYNEYTEASDCYYAENEYKKELRRNELIEFIKGFDPEIELSFVYGEYDPDYGRSESVIHRNLEQIVTALTDDQHWLEYLEEFGVNSVSKLRSYFKEHDDSGAGSQLVAVMIRKDYDKMKVNKEREALESAAQEIAGKANLEVASIEFINHLYSIIDSQNDYRLGMREDGLCIGWGVTPEQWFEERDASQADTEHVYRILNWLEKNCPLLWAQYKETKNTEVEA